jgi:hypothetical protein
LWRFIHLSWQLAVFFFKLVNMADVDGLGVLPKRPPNQHSSDDGRVRGHREGKVSAAPPAV